MEFAIRKSELNKALDKTLLALPSRTPLNIYKGILIETDDQGTIKLTSSDSEIRIEERIKAEEFEPGKTILPGKLFADIIRTLPDERVTVSSEDNATAYITTERSSFQISTFEADEYPSLDEYEEDKKLKINKDTFISLITKTSFAASKVEARGVIVGSLIDISDKKITMVALDGFRMAVAESEIDAENDTNAKIIISARILNNLTKLISDEEFENNDITIEYNEKKANAEIITANSKIIISLINGNYLDYEKLLPQNFKAEVTLNKEDFKKSIERASLMSADGRNNLVKLRFTNDNLRITARSESGNLEDNIPVSVSGADIEIGFNSHYLLEGLKAIDTENIIFKYDTSVRPCTMEPENGGYTYMILPVRII
ncbi:MAG: DNA polymerase III subunit beta [Eubacteriales bacterium]|nr:DNA polymerase III subunit beta [Eubacteriales bacterium]